MLLSVHLAHSCTTTFNDISDLSGNASQMQQFGTPSETAARQHMILNDKYTAMTHFPCIANALMTSLIQKHESDGWI